MNIQTVNYQSRVRTWVIKCFGERIADDMKERCYRFFEEATELVQALGMTAEECHRLVDYVFGRPSGDPQQETGGVMVTLNALGCAAGIEVHKEGLIELERINQPAVMERIREKQKKKPRFLDEDVPEGHRVEYVRTIVKIAA